MTEDVTGTNVLLMTNTAAPAPHKLPTFKEVANMATNTLSSLNRGDVAEVPGLGRITVLRIEVPGACLGTPRVRIEYRHAFLEGVEQASLPATTPVELVSAAADVVALAQEMAY